MAVNALKIRLGAPDFQQLVIGTTTVDIGSSIGGAELTYNPTTLLIEVDQAIMPVNAYKTKEEIEYAVAVAEFQMNRVSAVWSMAQTGITTVVTGTLSAPTGGTATPVGTPASTTYTYTWVAFSSGGDSVPGTGITTTTGPTTLGSINYVQVTGPSAVTGAVGYKLIRTVGGAAQGLIFTQYGNTPPTSVNDTGLVATAYTAAGSAPSYPNSDSFFFGNQISVPQATFDFAVPKNDSTTNHLRGHLNKVVSAKSSKIGFFREKATTADKLAMVAIADLTQPVGQQAGWIREEY